MTDTDTLFRLLTNESRRRILLLLCQEDSLLIPDDLQTRGRSRVQSPNGPSGRRRQERRFLVEMHHTHLPKLADKDLIEWDRDTDIITKGPTFTQIEPALRVFLKNAERFPRDLI